MVMTNATRLMGEPVRGGASPWGSIQQVDKVAEGIWFVTTAGHGGFYLDEERQAMMPQYTPSYADAPWHEEDCESAIVYLVHGPWTEDVETEPSASRSCLDVVKGVYGAELAEKLAARWAS